MNATFRTEFNFTETYRKFYNEHPAIREAYCLKALYPDVLSPIEEGDLFAGRFLSSPGVNKLKYNWNANKHNLSGIGFLSLSPGYGPGAGYFCHENTLNKKLQDINADNKTISEVNELINFWKTETIAAKVRAAYPSEIALALPFDTVEGKDIANPAFPLIRMTGPHFDFDKLLIMGIPGLHQQITMFKSKYIKESGEYNFYTGALIAIEVLTVVCKYYANQASELYNNILSAEKKKDLMLIVDSLINIQTHAPENLHEAIQLTLLYGIVSNSFSWGRMDEYLGDFYVADLKSGRLTEKSALRLVQNFWQLINDQGAPYDNRVIIGGRGRRNEDHADKFALLAIEATRTVHETLPQLSLRFYKGQNAGLLELAYKSIAEGRTFPMLYNDDVNIPSVEKAMNISANDAEQYLPYGCGEYVIYKKSVHTPSGAINLLKVLECTLHNGYENLTKRKSGISMGSLRDFRSFEQLWNAYARNVEYWVYILSKQQKIEYNVVGQETAQLYWSILYDDCIEKGKPVFSGGLNHLGGTMESYGQINTADSLLAIKTVLYDQKAITANELMNALDMDFQNNEILRRKLLTVPKYGNDNIEADEMAKKVHLHVCNYARSCAVKNGLDSYLVVIINNLMNTVLGSHTLASADGRKQFDSMANGNNPAPGMDINGITAFMNSLVKLDTSVHAGAVQNMKFSKNYFSKYKTRVSALLNTYFKIGGAQAMITVIDKGILEDAMKYPEKYPNVMVRVGGFSARFVELSKEVQFEILRRTLYEENF